MYKANLSIDRVVYLPSEIQKMLGISKTSTYKLLEEAFIRKTPFVVLKIGRLYRVPKDSFDCWYNRQILENES